MSPLVRNLKKKKKKFQKVSIHQVEAKSAIIADEGGEVSRSVQIWGQNFFPLFQGLDSVSAGSFKELWL